MQQQKIILSGILIILLTGCGGGDRHEYTGVLEGTVVKVPALTGGKILSLLTEDGQNVTKGQALAVIDTTDLMLQRLQVSAQLEELEIQNEIARTQLSKSEKDLNYIREKYDRISRLYRENSVPRQNLDDIENQLQQVTSLETTARQQILSLVARKKQLNIQHRQIDKKIADAKISAPLSGIVSSTYFEESEAIQPGGALLEITSIHTMETKIYINEKMLSQVRHGQHVKISVDGIDSTWGGKISWISPKAEFTPKTILTPETRTSLVYAVKIALENRDQILKHGMPVVINL
jgi:HlyD family secretion protein